MGDMLIKASHFRKRLYGVSLKCVGLGVRPPEFKPQFFQLPSVFPGNLCYLSGGSECTHLSGVS